MDLLGMSASILILVGALALLNLLTFNDIKDSVTKTIGILLVLGGLQVIFGLRFARFGGNNKLSISIFINGIRYFSYGCRVKITFFY